ncbi:MAG: SDR family oxidoreductase [Elusimicrobia bacterium]|nr:SDR family oxidoreductase [Elusimicrobiota bacterium]
MRLKDRVVVVTGAARGIGRAIASACLREGALVGVNYRSSAEAARELCKSSDRLFPLPFDVSDPEAVTAAVAKVLEARGAIDGWVNNAAVNLPDLLVSAETPKMRAQVETNLLGPLYCCRAVLPAMLERRRGVIVNVGSVSAARPTRGQAVYAATKGGLESLTRALAAEYGRKGVRAHCVRPGPIDTDMLEAAKALAGEEILARVPLKRLGRPEDVAELVVYLLSDEAAFSTGGVHTIDGGYLVA